MENTSHIRLNGYQRNVGKQKTTMMKGKITMGLLGTLDDLEEQEKKKLNIPARFAEKSFDNFIVTKHNEAKVKYCLDFGKDT